jgi:uncharacterized membrane protein
MKELEEKLNGKISEFTDSAKSAIKSHSVLVGTAIGFTAGDSVSKGFSNLSDTFIQPIIGMATLQTGPMEAVQKIAAGVPGSITKIIELVVVGFVISKILSFLPKETIDVKDAGKAEKEM